MRTSASQFLLLVEYMERNGDLSKPTEGPQGRAANIRRWAELTRVLNSDATGDTKTVEKWRKCVGGVKVWSDLKNNTKKKSARIHRAAQGTGGGPASNLKLSDLEQRILSIISTQAATGIDEIPEVGLESRPSLEQVVAIVDFMEKHQTLALGLLRGLEGREESKKLWFQLTRIVNGITGPTRPMKSWIKYWADKKSTVRNKVISGGGDPNSLCSNIEKKIWDLFLSNDTGKTRSSVKQESHFTEDNFYNEDSMDQNHVESEPVLAFEEPMVDFEERQTAVMEKLVKVMSDQATAMSQMAHACHANSQAMERLAESSHIQARALDRLATTFETISTSTHDIGSSIVDIDSTLKRFYSTTPT